MQKLNRMPKGHLQFWKYFEKTQVLQIKVKNDMSFQNGHLLPYVKRAVIPSNPTLPQNFAFFLSIAYEREF